MHCSLLHCTADMFREVRKTIPPSIIRNSKTVCDNTGPCTALHWTALHCTALNCTELHCTALFYTALLWTALHCTALHCTALHCSTLHCTALYCTVLHCTALHCTALHCSSLWQCRHLMNECNKQAHHRPTVPGHHQGVQQIFRRHFVTQTNIFQL